ncbi:MAG: hypothetical protein JWP17_945 [Solirubrobacterales bacterium]|nr:hypothetical protein [Solirubrobacterales bacterium]
MGSHETGSFTYSNPQAIHWGPGSLAQLAPELQRLGVGRAAVVTTRSLLSGTDLVARVRGALGEAQAPATEVIGQHAPISEIASATERAGVAEVDGIVSFGGGSAIDGAKMIAATLAERRGLAPADVPHVAIPTTLSVAELFGGGGLTDAAGDKKPMQGVSRPLDAVIYDAELTVATPLDLWLSSGIRALDHAVEGVLAEGAHPFSDVLALEAVRRLFASLPQVRSDPSDLAARTTNQLAAWFSYTLPQQSAFGLSHVMGKQIGARHGIPHGVTSCLLLPHVMRYMAPREPQRMAALAEATGSESAPDAVAELVATLGLPQHLADFGVGEADLRRAAEELAGRHPAEELWGIYRAAL